MIAELAASLCFRIGGRASRRNDPYGASRWLLASLAHAPGTSISWLRLGNEMMELGDVHAALGCFRRAMHLAPSDPGPRFNAACALLTLGQFEEGWSLYESRYAIPSFSQRNGLVGGDSSKIWRGEDLPGKTILLFAEQGLGDSIMAMRYVPIVASQAAWAILRVPAPLFRLARSSFSWVENLHIISDGERIPHHDCFAPLMSLPARYARSGWTVRSSYLDVGGADNPIARLSPMQVGVVWSGGEYLPHRNIPIETIAPLFDIPGVAFTSLQTGRRAEEIKVYPNVRRVRVADFYDTARIMKSLDLVISVDTSSAHLAGALGVPVWTLIRFNGEWRWLRDRVDTPLYRSMSLFRQPSPGDWDRVIDDVADLLQHRVAASTVSSRTA